MRVERKTFCRERRRVVFVGKVGRVVGEHYLQRKSTGLELDLGLEAAPINVFFDRKRER